MGKIYKPRSANLYGRATRAISSKVFFYLVLLLSILQGLWYAVTFRPGIFDEGTHFGLISEYSQRFNPFISDQTPEMDQYGEVTRNPTYLFYYLLSWPLRFIGLFTDNTDIQVVGLRMIMLAFFVAGLIYFRRVFFRLGAPKSLAHIVLLFFILIPSVAPFAGALNYDNIIFFLFPFSLLLAMDIAGDKRANSKKIIGFLILGLLGSLIKFTFIALYAPLFIYVIYSIYRKPRTDYFYSMSTSFMQLSLMVKTILIVSLIISAGLFTERLVLNTFRFHNPSPECTQILSKERCMKNYTAARNINYRESKPNDFSPLNPFAYTTTYWIPSIITTQVKVNPDSDTLPIMNLLFSILVFLGPVLVLIYLRDFLTKNYYPLIFIVIIAYTGIFFLNVYFAYINLGQPIAISSRYLMPIMPILLLLVALSIRRLMGEYRKTLLAGVLLVLAILFTQGGSIGATSLAPGMHKYYWQNSSVLNANRYINGFFQKTAVVVKDT